MISFSSSKISMFQSFNMNQLINQRELHSKRIGRPERMWNHTRARGPGGMIKWCNLVLSERSEVLL